MVKDTTNKEENIFPKASIGPNDGIMDSYRFSAKIQLGGLNKPKQQNPKTHHRTNTHKRTHRSSQNQ